MNSGESHCTHELASDVWREGRQGRGRGEGGRHDIQKSNNPHLARGENMKHQGEE